MYSSFTDKYQRLARLSQRRPVSLDLGCGPTTRFPDWIGIDSIDYPCVDVVGDVYAVMAAIPDGSVDRVYASHVLEHLVDLGLAMTELGRIVASGGIVEIVVPHFSNPYFYSDPTHKCHFGLYTLSYYCSDAVLARALPTYVKRKDFELVNVKLGFRCEKRGLLHILRRAVSALVNIGAYTQELYEEVFPFLFPCYEITFRLRHY